jgi:hypothetical protein
MEPLQVSRYLISQCDDLCESDGSVHGVKETAPRLPAGMNKASAHDAPAKALPEPFRPLQGNHLDDEAGFLGAC